MNIAIVGCGLGGASILKALISHNNFNDDIKIHIFEKREELAVGLAYEKGDHSKLLNVKLKYASLDVGNPDHLYKWIDENLEGDYLIEGMLPRPIYGEYIKDSFDQYMKNENVTINKEGVTDLYRADDKYKLVTESALYKEDFDAVFLAIGQPHYRDSYELKEDKNFIYRPFPLDEQLADISSDDRVGIIGTGPTAIDIYRFLKKQCDIKRSLYFFTRDTAFKPVAIDYEKEDKVCSIDNHWIDEHIDDEGFLDLDEILATAKADFKKAGVDFNAVYEKYKDTDLKKYRTAIKENDQALAFCQTYCMEIWEFMARLYNSLKGVDKLEAYNDHIKKVDFLITKTPQETIKNILADYDAGNIKIIRDTEEVKLQADCGFRVSFKEHEDVEVDKIINAQGFIQELETAIEGDKFLENLYDRRFIEPDIEGKFIRVTYPSYNLINKKYGHMENIYLSGMWAGGTDVLNNDLRSIITAAELMAKDFMDKLS